MSSYDPSQWYSYSKNRPNEVPAKTFLADAECDVADSSNVDGKQCDESKSSSGTSQQPEQSGLDQIPKREEIKLDSISTSLQSSNSKVNNFIKRLQKMVRELPR